jgi:ferredoxin-thioredoxin reductase catalytic subunit
MYDDLGNHNYFAEYCMLFLRRRGNERDIFEIALDGTSLFRRSCIDVIKSRLRKNLKAPAKQHAVFSKAIICPCYCIVFP